MEASTNHQVTSRASVIYSWLLISALSLFAVYPALIYKIEEHTYDAAISHVFRGVLFSEARADGVFYPRWLQPLNGGLGGPLFSFYSPLAYFFLDLWHQLGISHPLAWRLTLALALAIAALSSFGMGLALFKRIDASLVCAVCFTYSHYLLQEFFERGSTQGIALAISPLVFWALLLLAERPTGWRFLSTTVSWAMVALIHNATAILLLPVLALFSIYALVQNGFQRLPIVIGALICGSLLTAFYTVPSVLELQYVQITNFTKANYTRPAENSLALTELLSFPPVFDIGFGSNSMGQRVSPFQTLAILSGLPLAIFFYRQRKKVIALLAFGLASLSLITLWFMTDTATPVWQAIPALAVFQFRWRFLSLLGISAAVLLGCLLDVSPPRWRGAFLLLVLSGVIGFQLPSLYPELLRRYITMPPNPTVTDVQTFALRAGYPGLTTFNEFLPIWRTLPFPEEEVALVRASLLANLPKQGSIVSENRSTGRLQVELKTPVAFEACLRTLYFPGWVGYVDEQPSNLRAQAETGYSCLDVPSGQHTLNLVYEGTVTQHIATGISFVALVAVVTVAAILQMTTRQFNSGPVSSVAYPSPRWGIIIVLLGVIAIKAFVLDQTTSIFRQASACERMNAPLTQTDVSFDNQFRLCAYSLPQRVFSTGDTVRVELYWQASQPLTEPTLSYVHLLGQVPLLENAPVGGKANKELAISSSILAWVPGKIYKEVYEIKVGTPPPGPYQLEIGFWQPQLNQRLRPKVLQPSEGLVEASAYNSLLLTGITLR